MSPPPHTDVTKGATIRRLEDFEPDPSSGPGKKAHIVSLGCPKNLVDTERHVATLQRRGYALANTPEEADLLFVNTCGFIDNAKTESIETILEIAEEKRDDQKLVVAGCLVDRYPNELKNEMPEVDLWINLETFAEEERAIEDLGAGETPEGYKPLQLNSPDTESGEPDIPWASFPRVVLTPKHTAYLKISEGCDHKCGFCAIPSFRGKHRSVPLDSLLLEARGLAERGAKEITLIGQDVISYGRDLTPDRSTSLRTLLEALNETEGLEWVRVLYTYPTRLADEMEWAYANLDKMIPYLDLPLQHLSDPVLERMRRGTPYAKIKDHVERLRQAAPGLVVRSTCIVGYPGETAEDYELLLERFAELDVDHLGVFRYSDEESTHAEGLSDKVDGEEADRRLAEMTTFAAQSCQDKATARLGNRVRVLVDAPTLPPTEAFPEARSGTWFQGRWFGQAPEIDGVVYFTSEQAEPGGFVEVELKRVVYPDYLGVV